MIDLEVETLRTFAAAQVLAKQPYFKAADGWIVFRPKCDENRTYYLQNQQILRDKRKARYQALSSAERKAVNRAAKLHTRMTRV